MQTNSEKLSLGIAASVLGIILLLLVACAEHPTKKAVKHPAEELEQTDLFIAGVGGYHTYRIPSLIVSRDGTVLAFVEGRKDSAADHGHNDILMRRSKDAGKTWGPVQLVAKDDDNALNNPTAVVDRTTGTIFLCLIRTSTKKYKTEKDIDKSKGPVSQFWVMQSDDDGKTWTGPRDITRSVNRPGWKRVIPGPGVGIQLRDGRLVIPCNHVIGHDAYNHIIYSDDHGKTWHLGGSTEGKMDESQIVQLDNGWLMLNMRNYRDKGHRGIAISKDEGLTWSKVTNDPTLIEPICQASLIRYTGLQHFMRSRLLFSNPASQTVRDMLTIRLSYDDAKTWPVSRVLNAGPSAYSCLTVLPGMGIGCLYERGDHSAYEKVTFAKFTLAWLTNGKDTLKRRSGT